MNSKWTEFIQGAIKELPIQIGVVPFGIIYGATAINFGLTELQVIASSIIIFGGASQLVFVQLLAQGMPMTNIVSSVTLINLRHTLYGMSLLKDLKHLPLYWRIVLAYLLTDEAYAVTVVRFQEKPNANMHYYLLGSGLVLFTSWLIATVIGVFIGEVIPEYLGLDFMIPLTFLALIASQAQSRSHKIAIGIAVVTTTIAILFAWQYWLLGSALIAVILATMIEQIWGKGHG